MSGVSIVSMGEQTEQPGRTPVHPGQRVLSSDYGQGTISGVAPPWVFIQWDKPFIPGANRVVAHEVAFAERLEKIADEEAVSPQGSTPEG